MDRKYPDTIYVEMEMTPTKRDLYIRVLRTVADSCWDRLTVDDADVLLELADRMEDKDD